MRFEKWRRESCLFIESERYYSEKDEDYDEDNDDVDEVVEPKAKKAKGPGRPIGSKTSLK